jgi:hypothetical protein
MKKTLIASAISAALILNGLPVMAATQQTAAISPVTSEGFTMVPAYPNSVNPRKVLFEIKPGGTGYDYVYIKNFSSEPAHFSLYGADPTVSNTGSLAYKTREKGMEQAGEWLKFDDPELDLGPMETKMVGFQVNVPEDTALDTYKVGLAMEKSKKDVNNPSVTIATRYISHAEVKVTNDPQPIPRQGQVPPPKKAVFETYYFWVSLVLFIMSFGLLAWVTLHEKKSAKQHKSTHRKKA